MARPRFLTAIAVSAAVCEDSRTKWLTTTLLPHILSLNGYWLKVLFEPATKKTQWALPVPEGTGGQKQRESICARTYLRVPSIFGFHGVYKPLAWHLGIVDDDFRLADNGYALLKAWQMDRGLDGFLTSSTSTGEGTKVRQLLRSAVEDGLREACTRRSTSWQGWTLLAQHLAPVWSEKERPRSFMNS